MSFVTRNDDYGMFQPGGYFEYLDDERQNSLPPPVLGGDARTAPDGIQKYDSEQMLNFINEARLRPPERSNRLQRLTEKTNMENEWQRYQARFEYESLATHWHKMISTIVGIMNDMLNIKYEDVENKTMIGNTMDRIFLKDDRLLYFGLVLVLSAMIWKSLS